MNPKSHQAVFFKTEPAEHYCISTNLALYKRVLHKKTLNFQGIEGTSQQFCAHCPYLREEWSQGLVHGPDRYEPRETTSYHHGPAVQPQQANINTILSKSCSHWRVLSWVLHARSCNRETAKKCDLTVSSSQWRRDTRRFWKCCSFPLLVVCTAKLNIT